MDECWILKMIVDRREVVLCQMAFGGLLSVNLGLHFSTRIS